MSLPSSFDRLGRNVLVGVMCALAALVTSGCATHRALSKHTLAANLTTGDIYYEQVLNNVARFMVNPASMPSFSVIAAGTVNIADDHEAGISPTLSPTLTAVQQGGGALPILSILFGLSAKRGVTENWSTTPVTDSDNIRRMRCAFQYVVGTETSECDRCKARLEGFMLGGTETFDCMLPRGWYGTGTKADVPHNACFVANYCDTYVWVMPDGIDGFTRFTITILDIATGEIRAPHRTVVKKYRGEPEPGNLETTEITVSEIDPEALKKDEPFRQDRVRPDAPILNRGLFFVPR